ncbi:MAG: hypothetical protein KDD43_08850 [Bdellovibrionales bacterium]|nr:hypothetical protein [Bdellovibrionales bacterium]
MARDASSILCQPGELIWGATDLSIASPHGGNSLGWTKDGVRFFHGIDTRNVLSEENGVAIQEIIYLGANIRMSATLQQWDDNVLARVFPNTDTGGTSGEKVVEFPGDSLTPGGKMSTLGGVLVFSPTDLTNNKVILFRNAVPVANLGDSFFMGTSKDTEMAVIFKGLPDSSIPSSGDARYASRTGAIGDRRDLTIAAP